MPSATKKKVGTRNVLGSPYVPIEACPKLKKILRKTLQGVWPPRAPSSKSLIRKDPNLLKLPSKEERAKQLKELKSRSSYPLHPDRRFVKAGLKSCLRSLPEISLLLLDKTNPNIDSLSSTLFPLQRPDLNIFLVEKLSVLCEEFLGFHCLSLGFTRDIEDPGNHFHEAADYAAQLIASLKKEKELSKSSAEPLPKKPKLTEGAEKKKDDNDFGADFISFGKNDSDDELSSYLSPNVLRIPVVHKK
eukprot:TRINITY_DN2930_c0_g1_i1.p1 TRINITY_DN2930_c0_g1~~TRINITY_DN2930_c0_g1_i1.p1  ORF type:complete len:246 (+),score=70.82 TRINITY_DN2930_c0_g1_i1:38-775(+)